MGIDGAKAWRKGEDWRKYMRSWQGLGKADTRLRSDSKLQDDRFVAMRANIVPPSDVFIKTLADERGIKYTIGKKVKDRFYGDDGRTSIYPDNDGFIGEPIKITLKAGSMLVDRYGNGNGRFVSPYKTPFEQRALPKDVNKDDYNSFRIIKDLEVLSGKTAPWFNQEGRGVQYKLPKKTFDLIEEGYLELANDDV